MRRLETPWSRPRADARRPRPGRPGSAPAAPRSRRVAAEPLGRTIGHVGLALRSRSRDRRSAPATGRSSRSPDLSRAPDNPAVIAAARNVVRGAIVDRDGKVLASNKRSAKTGEPYRVYADRAFSTVIGYASPSSARPGSSAPYDAELTGVSNGDPIGGLLRKFEAEPIRPPEADPEISCRLQQAALAGLGDDRGAVVMLDPRTGEMLALASSPTYDAAPSPTRRRRRTAFAALLGNNRQPLLPRATQGQYVPGLGVQDRDRDRRPRLGRDHARRRRSPSSRRRRRTACSCQASASATATTRRRARRR